MLPIQYYGSLSSKDIPFSQRVSETLLLPGSEGPSRIRSASESVESVDTCQPPVAAYGTTRWRVKGTEVHISHGRTITVAGVVVLAGPSVMGG